MHGEQPAYGLWGLVLVNVGVFVFFTLSFFKPRSKTDWRTLGSFWGFIVALFVEMYGFPLTIYLLSGWLRQFFPEIDLLAHDAGHLWHSVLGFDGNPHLNPVHILSNVLIVGGLLLLSASWRVLFRAQQEGRLAVEGPYARVRHPQYIAFLAVMIGFLIQWPTLLTLAMFPILALRYVKLAHREETDVAAEFPSAWREYIARTPRWLPRLGGGR